MAASPEVLDRISEERAALYDAADASTARENIKDKLLRGKKVGRFTIDAAFEVGMGEEMKEREILGILISLTAAETSLDLREVQDRAVKLVDALIDGHMADEISSELETFDTDGRARRSGL
jgi:hypothetical protein